MNNRGAIAVMSAILAMPVLLGFGLALDASMLWVLRQRLQWAVDDAALLGASQTNGEAANLVTRDAKELFWASYGAPLTSYTSGTQVGYLGSSSAGATVTNATAANSQATPPVVANPHVTVTASATLPTTLMRILGQNSSTITVTGVAAVPHKVEMTLVLDNSLSMGLAISGGTKLDALQTAANNLLTTILGNGASASPNVSIGIVPFGGSVNVGTDSVAQSFLKFGTQSSKFSGSVASNLAWRGCVQARAYVAPAISYDTTEDAPTTDALKFNPYYYPSTKNLVIDPSTRGAFYPGDNDWTVGDVSSVNDTSTVAQDTNTNYLTGAYWKGPNLYCPHATLVRLTNDKAALSNAINSMAIVNGGGTIINQGLQWGWFAVSPLWASLWGLPSSPTGAARPAAYTDNGTTKIIVLMTDGVSEVDGMDSWYGAAAKQYSDQHSNCENIPKVQPECNGSKQANQPDSWHTSYGRVSSNVLVTPNASHTGDYWRDQAMSELRNRLVGTNGLCANIKAQNIILYTIFFHGSLDDTYLQATANGAGTDLQTCATDANHYFNSQSATAINAAFQSIAQDINDLRVTQ